MPWSKVKSVKKLEGDAQHMWDISCYPTPSFFANDIGVHNCVYCESPLSGSYTVRAMNPQRIQDELYDIRDNYKIFATHFFDDEMNLFRDRFLNITYKIKEMRDFIWRGFVVTAKFDEEMARAAKESNCYELASGLESGSPTILRAIKKPATVDINRRFVRTAKKFSLRIKGFFICGLPQESWSTIKETDKFLEGLKQEGCALDDYDFSILQVYKGAPVFLNPQDIEFKKDWDEKAYYKAGPDAYGQGLVQVRTKAMSEYDLVAARNYLESKWKRQGWLGDYGRKDLDRIYERSDVADSIRHAEKMIASA